MKIDDDLDPFLVSEPIGPFLDRLNFGSQPFGGGIGNRMRETGQNIFNVTFERCADLSSVSGRCGWPTRTIASGSPGRRPLLSETRGLECLPSWPKRARLGFFGIHIVVGKKPEFQEDRCVEQENSGVAPFLFFLRAGYSFWRLAFDLLIIPLLGPLFRLLVCSSQGMEDAPHMIEILQTE